MAVDRIIGLIPLVLLTPLIISGRFLNNESSVPTEDDRRFEDGERIPLFASKVFSRSNSSHEAYPYFDLPFCPPGEPINSRKKSLTEILSGGCFTNTQYEIRFKKSSFDNFLCEKTLTRAEVAKFRDAVKGGFEYELSFSDQILRGVVGIVDKTDVSRPRYYLITQHRFYPLYNGNQVKRIFVFDDFDSAVDITEDDEIIVKFTYSVLWTQVWLEHDYESSELFVPHGWRSILSLVFWPSAAFCLFGLLLLLVLSPSFVANFSSYRVITRSRYSHESVESARAVNYSRPIHGNNCNCPPYSSLLGAFLGTGIQLLTVACNLFFLAYIRRTLSLGAILVAFCLTSLVSGYNAVTFHLKFTRLGWKECIFLAGTLYFVPACLTVFSVNIVAQLHYGESKIAEIGESFKVLIACGIFTGVLSILGGIFAYCSKGKTSKVPCATRTTTTTRRETLPQPWYRNTLAQMFLGGLPPFVYITPSMDSIYASLMNPTVCGALNTIFTNYIMIISWTAVLAIGFARLIDQPKKDYLWWWRSVLRGGSTAIYMFFYSIYFASKLDIEGPFLVVCLGYNVAVFYALFLILGTISFYISLISHHGLEKNE